MKRRIFIRLLALGACDVAGSSRHAFPHDAVAAATIRPRADRAWLYGRPGACAGSRGVHGTWLRELLGEELS